MSSRERTKDTKSKRDRYNDFNSKSSGSTRKRSRSRSKSHSRSRVASDRHNLASNDAKNSLSGKAGESSHQLHSDAERQRSDAHKAKSDSNHHKSSDSGKSKSQNDRHKHSHEHRSDSSRKNGTVRERGDIDRDSHRSTHSKHSKHRPDKETRNIASSADSSSVDHRMLDAAKSSDHQLTHRADSEKQSADVPRHRGSIHQDVETPSSIGGLESIALPMEAEATGELNDAEASDAAARKRTSRFFPAPSVAPVKFTLSKKPRQMGFSNERAFRDDEEASANEEDRSNAKQDEADLLREPDFQLGEMVNEIDELPPIGSSTTAGVMRPGTSTSAGDAAAVKTKENFQIVFDPTNATRLVEAEQGTVNDNSKDSTKKPQGVTTADNGSERQKHRHSRRDRHSSTRHSRSDKHDHRDSHRSRHGSSRRHEHRPKSKSRTESSAMTASDHPDSSRSDAVNAGQVASNLVGVGPSNASLPHSSEVGNQAAPQLSTGPDADATSDAKKLDQKDPAQAHATQIENNEKQDALQPCTSVAEQSASSAKRDHDKSEAAVNDKGDRNRRHSRSSAHRSAHRKHDRGRDAPSQSQRNAHEKRTHRGASRSRGERHRHGSRSRRRSRSRSKSHRRHDSRSRRRDRRRSNSSSNSSNSTSSSSSSSSSRSRGPSHSRSRSRSHQRDGRRSRSRSRSRSRGGHRSRSKEARRSRSRHDGGRRQISQDSRPGFRRQAANEAQNRTAAVNQRQHDRPRRSSRSPGRYRTYEHHNRHANSYSRSYRDRDDISGGTGSHMLARDTVAAFVSGESNVDPEGLVPISTEEYEQRVAQFLMHTQRGSANSHFDLAGQTAIAVFNSEHNNRLALATPSESVSALALGVVPSPTPLATQVQAQSSNIDYQALMSSLTSLQQRSADLSSDVAIAAGNLLPLPPAFHFGLTNAVVQPGVTFSSRPIAINSQLQLGTISNFPPGQFPPAVYGSSQYTPYLPHAKLEPLRANGLPPHTSRSEVIVRSNSFDDQSTVAGAAQTQADHLGVPLKAESEVWRNNGTELQSPAEACQVNRRFVKAGPQLDHSLSQSSTSILDTSLTQPVKPKARWMNMLSESDSSSSPPPPPPPVANAQPEKTVTHSYGLRRSEDCSRKQSAANLRDDAARKAEKKRSEYESNSEDESDRMIYSRSTREPLFEMIYECEMASGKRGRALRGRHQRAIRRMVCACSSDDAVPCGAGCLNRMLFIECGADCPCGDACTNRQFQQRRYAPIKLTKAGAKGFGLIALATLEPDTFLLEYVGELLDTNQFTKRVREYDRSGKAQHHYFMQLNSESIIDATRKGNLSRFFNHSCDPNCETQKWTVNGQLRVGFFTQRRVERGEELTFDYQFQLYGDQQQKCYCGSAKCRGYLGTVRRAGQSNSEVSLCGGVGNAAADSKNLPDVSASSSKMIRVAKAALGGSLEQFGTGEIEEAIRKLVGRARTGLRTADQTLQLCRLLMRAERAEDRRALLDLLLLTAEHADNAADSSVTANVNATGGIPGADAGSSSQANCPAPAPNPVDDPVEQMLANRFVTFSNNQGQLRTFVNYHGLSILRMLLADVRNAASADEEAAITNADSNAEMRLLILRVLRVLPVVYKKEIMEANLRSLLERWLVEITEKQAQQATSASALTEASAQSDDAALKSEVKSECEATHGNAADDVAQSRPAMDAENGAADQQVSAARDTESDDLLPTSDLVAAARITESVAVATAAATNEFETQEDTQIPANATDEKSSELVSKEQLNVEDGDSKTAADVPTDPGANDHSEEKSINCDLECKLIIEELFAKWLSLKDGPYKIPKRQAAPSTPQQSNSVVATDGRASASSVTLRQNSAVAQPQQQKRFNNKKNVGVDPDMSLEMIRQQFEESERARMKAEKRNAMLIRLQAQLMRLLDETLSNGFVTVRDDEPERPNYFVNTIMQLVGVFEEEGRVFVGLVQLGKPPMDATVPANQRTAVIQLERPITLKVNDPRHYESMQFATAAEMLSATLLNAQQLPNGADAGLVNHLQANPSLISAALSGLSGLGLVPMTDGAQSASNLLASTGEVTSTTATVLPPNWASVETDDGRTYYYHTLTRKTQWTFPTIEEDAAENIKAGATNTNQSASPGHSHSHADTSSSGLLNFASREADAADRKALKRLVSETVVRQLSKLRTRHGDSLDELSNSALFKELARRLSNSIYEKELKRMLASNKLSRIRLEADEDLSPSAEAASGTADGRKGKKRSRKAGLERDNVRRKAKKFIVQYVHVKLTKVARRRKRAAKALKTGSNGSASPASIGESAKNESANQDGSGHSCTPSEANRAESSKRLEATLSRMIADSDDAESEADDAEQLLCDAAWKAACASQSELDVDAELNRNDADADAVSSSKRPKLATNTD